MDFRAIWPLLVKDKWTASPPKGLDIHYDYVKPGCKRSSGTRGVDYFNGEDELVGYVRSNADICARHGISNVVVRWKDPIGTVEGRPSRVTAHQEPPPKKAKTTRKVVAAPRADKTLRSPQEGSCIAQEASCSAEKDLAAKKASPTSTKPKPKKRTKKHIAEEAAEKRRELARFDRVWGEQNAQENDGQQVEAPLSVRESARSNECSPEGYADGCAAPNNTADSEGIPSDTNDRASTGGRGRVGAKQHYSSSSRRVPSSDEDSEYSAPGSDYDSEDEIIDVDAAGGSTELPVRQADALPGSDTDALDTNLVTGELDTFLESDGEGQEGPGENAGDSDSDCDDELEENESIARNCHASSQELPR